MKKAIIFAFIVIVLCISFFAFIYFYYEKPQQVHEASPINLSLYAVEKGRNERIVIGYKIYVNGILHSEGETLKDGAILEQVLANSSIQIESFNLIDQEYYIFSQEFYTSLTENKRIVIKLISPQEIIINHSGILGLDKINVSIIANETIPVKICISYTTHFIYVKANLTKIETFNGFDKCYQAIINDILNLSLEYETFGELNSNDKIEIAVFDREDTKPLIYEINYGY